MNKKSLINLVDIIILDKNNISLTDINFNVPCYTFFFTEIIRDVLNEIIKQNKYILNDINLIIIKNKKREKNFINIQKTNQKLNDFTFDIYYQDTGFIEKNIIKIYFTTNYKLIINSEYNYKSLINSKNNYLGNNIYDLIKNKINDEFTKDLNKYSIGEIYQEFIKKQGIIEKDKIHGSFCNIVELCEQLKKDINDTDKKKKIIDFFKVNDDKIKINDNDLNVFNPLDEYDFNSYYDLNDYNKQNNKEENKQNNKEENKNQKKYDQNDQPENINFEDITNINKNNNNFLKILSILFNNDFYYENKRFKIYFSKFIDDIYNSSPLKNYGDLYVSIRFIDYTIVKKNILRNIIFNEINNLHILGNINKIIVSFLINANYDKDEIYNNTFIIYEDKEFNENNINKNDINKNNIDENEINKLFNNIKRYLKNKLTINIIDFENTDIYIDIKFNEYTIINKKLLLNIIEKEKAKLNLTNNIFILMLENGEYEK